MGEAGTPRMHDTVTVPLRNSTAGQANFSIPNLSILTLDFAVIAFTRLPYAHCEAN